MNANRIIVSLVHSNSFIERLSPNKRQTAYLKSKAQTADMINVVLNFKPTIETDIYALYTTINLYNFSSDDMVAKSHRNKSITVYYSMQ